MTIKLIDAAKYYKELPHQLAAWNWLQEQLTKKQLNEFAELYRSAVDPKPAYQNTWNGIRQAAADTGAKFPEVVAAQWALESGWGKHTSGKNNYFGLNLPKLFNLMIVVGFSPEKEKLERSCSVLHPAGIQQHGDSSDKENQHLQ